MEPENKDLKPTLTNVNTHLQAAIPPLSTAANQIGTIPWEQRGQLGFDLQQIQTALQYLTAVKAQIDQYLQEGTAEQ